MAIVSILEVHDALKEIREYKNLRMFQQSRCEEFCKKYDITPGQFNFLISVIAVERLNQVKSKNLPI